MAVTDTKPEARRFTLATRSCGWPRSASLGEDEKVEFLDGIVWIVTPQASTTVTPSQGSP